MTTARSYGEKISKHFDSKINFTKVPQGNPDAEFLEDIKKNTKSRISNHMPATTNYTGQANASSFLGLQSYTEAQSNLFFGRDAETDTLTSLIRVKYINDRIRKIRNR